jgi:hypothetical protein
VEIRIEKGPLDRERLASIAALYGRADPRYASVEFCEWRFNRSPAGRSLHAFAHDGDRVVATQSLIPLEAIARGRGILTAKSEALFVEPTHRRALVEHEGKSLPLVLALATALHRFADDQGIEVVHMIVESSVGVLMRFAGCVPVTRRDRAWVRVLDARALANGSRSKHARFAAAGLLQSGVSLLGQSLAALARPEIAQSGAPSAATLDLVERDRAAAVEGRGPWTVRPDRASLDWFLGRGTLDLLTLTDPARGYAVVLPNAHPGAITEIVDWRFAGLRLGEQAALLDLVCFRARERRASSVRFWDAAAPRRLRRAARTLGFLRTGEKARTLHVRSRDPYFRDPENLELSPYFYASF